MNIENYQNPTSDQRNEYQNHLRQIDIQQTLILKVASLATADYSFC